MHAVRRATTVDPRQFGRRPLFDLAQPVSERAVAIGADLRLFLTTFTAGFVFVSVLLV